MCLQPGWNQEITLLQRLAAWGFWDLHIPANTHAGYTNVVYIRPRMSKAEMLAALDAIDPNDPRTWPRNRCAQEGAPQDAHMTAVRRQGGE